MIKITVYGNPVAQGRPRFTTKSGLPKAYDPEDSRNAKALIAWNAKQICNKPLDGILVLHVKSYRSIPKSFSKIKRQKALEGSIRPVTKPDGDNYLKLVQDACNGIVWVDDAIIVDSRVQKFYSDEPRLEIEVSMIEP